MWRRPLYNATLVTATHRELERVFDETSTQVGVRMINKWRVKMIQKKIYKVKDYLWKKEGGEKEKENTVVIQIVSVFNCDLHTIIVFLDWKFIDINTSCLRLIII